MMPSRRERLLKEQARACAAFGISLREMAAAMQAYNDAFAAHSQRMIASMRKLSGEHEEEASRAAR